LAEQLRRAAVILPLADVQLGGFHARAHRVRLLGDDGLERLEGFVDLASHHERLLIRVLLDVRRAAAFDEEMRPGRAGGRAHEETDPSYETARHDSGEEYPPMVPDLHADAADDDATDHEPIRERADVVHGVRAMTIEQRRLVGLGIRHRRYHRLPCPELSTSERPITFPCLQCRDSYAPCLRRRC